MPIHERDPWRDQYFAGIACRADVHIPTDDVDAFAWQPAHRWIYNKLRIAESQGIDCGPHGVLPARYPVFAKPIYNLLGMGVDSRVLESPEDYHRHLRPGHMWMTLLTGDHVSTDAALVDGRVCWIRHTVGRPLGGGTFDYWVIEAAPRADLDRYCGAWLAAHLRGYTGMVNLETIGGRIIEVHLRFSDQWPDLYGTGWLAAMVALYERGEWGYADGDRADGYSVVLFGPHGRRFAHPPAALVEALRADPRISSVQITFTEHGAGAAHAMPPGGFRLAIVNTRELGAGLEARARLARAFELV
ncbi:MAG: hypothetical protein JSR54_02805 [Proteobacteria bacterium]|nr:hypothetical protein [Pseudomonadota bacterium]